MSEEVDYSAFYYKKTEGAVPTKVSEKGNTPEGKEKNKKSSKGKKILRTVFVLLLCGIAVFFCADFFGKGFLSDAVCSIFSEKTYTYYVVSENVSSRFVAYANSITVREKGGAGYIFTDDGYYVALSTYYDKQKGDAVRNKNSNSVVYSLQIRTKEEELMSAIDDFVKDFCDGAEGLEKGEAGEGELTELSLRYLTVFETLREKYPEQEGLFGLVKKGLEEFNFASTDRPGVLSSMRYLVCSVLFSAKDCL